MKLSQKIKKGLSPHINIQTNYHADFQDKSRQPTSTKNKRASQLGVMQIEQHQDRLVIGQQIQDPKYQQFINANNNNKHSRKQLSPQSQISNKQSQKQFDGLQNKNYVVQQIIVSNQLEDTQQEEEDFDGNKNDEKTKTLLLLPLNNVNNEHTFNNMQSVLPLQDSTTGVIVNSSQNDHQTTTLLQLRETNSIQSYGQNQTINMNSKRMTPDEVVVIQEGDHKNKVVNVQVSVNPIQQQQNIRQVYSKTNNNQKQSFEITSNVDQFSSNYTPQDLGQDSPSHLVQDEISKAINILNNQQQQNIQNLKQRHQPLSQRQTVVQVQDKLQKIQKTQNDQHNSKDEGHLNIQKNDSHEDMAGSSQHERSKFIIDQNQIGKEQEEEDRRKESISPDVSIYKLEPTKTANQSVLKTLQVGSGRETLSKEQNQMYINEDIDQLDHGANVVTLKKRKRRNQTQDMGAIKTNTQSMKFSVLDKQSVNQIANETLMQKESLVDDIVLDSQQDQKIEKPPHIGHIRNQTAGTKGSKRQINTQSSNNENQFQREIKSPQGHNIRSRTLSGLAAIAASRQNQQGKLKLNAGSLNPQLQNKQTDLQIQELEIKQMNFQNNQTQAVMQERYYKFLNKTSQNKANCYPYKNIHSINKYLNHDPNFISGQAPHHHNQFDRKTNKSPSTFSKFIQLSPRQQQLTLQQRLNDGLMGSSLEPFRMSQQTAAGMSGCDELISKRHMGEYMDTDVVQNSSQIGNAVNLITDRQDSEKIPFKTKFNKNGSKTEIEVNLKSQKSPSQSLEKSPSHKQTKHNTESSPMKIAQKCRMSPSKRKSQNHTTALIQTQNLSQKQEYQPKTQTNFNYIEQEYAMSTIPKNSTSIVVEPKAHYLYPMRNIIKTPQAGAQRKKMIVLPQQKMDPEDNENKGAISVLDNNNNTTTQRGPGAQIADYQSEVNDKQSTQLGIKSTLLSGRYGGNEFECKQLYDRTLNLSGNQLEIVQLQNGYPQPKQVNAMTSYRIVQTNRSQAKLQTKTKLKKKGKSMKASKQKVVVPPLLNVINQNSYQSKESLTRQPQLTTNTIVSEQNKGVTANASKFQSALNASPKLSDPGSDHPPITKKEKIKIVNQAHQKVNPSTKGSSKASSKNLIKEHNIPTTKNLPLYKPFLIKPQKQSDRPVQFFKKPNNTISHNQNQDQDTHQLLCKEQLYQKTIQQQQQQQQVGSGSNKKVSNKASGIPTSRNSMLKQYNQQNNTSGKGTINLTTSDDNTKNRQFLSYGFIQDHFAGAINQLHIKDEVAEQYQQYVHQQQMQQVSQNMQVGTNNISEQDSIQNQHEKNIVMGQSSSLEHSKIGSKHEKVGVESSLSQHHMQSKQKQNININLQQQSRAIDSSPNYMLQNTLKIAGDTTPLNKSLNMNQLSSLVQNYNLMKDLNQSSMSISKHLDELKINMIQGNATSMGNQTTENNRFLQQSSSKKHSTTIHQQQAHNTIQPQTLQVQVKPSLTATTSNLHQGTQNQFSKNQLVHQVMSGGGGTKTGLNQDIVQVGTQPFIHGQGLSPTSRLLKQQDEMSSNTNHQYVLNQTNLLMFQKAQAASQGQNNYFSQQLIQKYNNQNNNHSKDPCSSSSSGMKKKYLEMLQSQKKRTFSQIPNTIHYENNPTLVKTAQLSVKQSKHKQNLLQAQSYNPQQNTVTTPVSKLNLNTGMAFNNQSPTAANGPQIIGNNNFSVIMNNIGGLLNKQQ